MENPKSKWALRLEEANAKFEQFGYRIEVVEDEDIYFDIKIINRNAKSPNRYASGLVESELDAAVDEVIAYITGIVSAIDQREIYIVSYVGLSDDDCSADGYCEVKPFYDIDKAREYMRTLAENELEEQKDFHPETVVSEKNLIAIEWSGGSQRLHIELHKKKIE